MVPRNVQKERIESSYVKNVDGTETPTKKVTTYNVTYMDRIPVDVTYRDKTTESTSTDVPKAKPAGTNGRFHHFFFSVTESIKYEHRLTKRQTPSRQ